MPSRSRPVAAPPARFALSLRRVAIAAERTLLVAALVAAASSTASAAPKRAPATAHAAGAAAGPVAPAPYLARLPPLIEREALFGDPEISGGQLSPDGRFLSFRKAYHDVINVWVKRIEEPFDKARPVTADVKRPVVTYTWSRDGRYILYAQDKGGDENFRVYAVDPAAPADPKTGVPAARDLTPYANVRAQILALPKRTPRRILVGLNDRDPQLFDVYALDLETGKRELLFKNTENVAGWEVDLDGRLRLGERITGDGGSELLRVDGAKLTPVYRCSSDETCEPARFHKDGRRVYLQSNHGDADLTRLVLFDPQTKKEELVESDPEKQADFGGAEFSEATDELVATHYVGDRLRVYPRDPAFAHDYEVVRKALPKGDIHFTSSTRDDRLHLVALTSDVDPGATYLYDRASGKVDLVYRPYPKLPLDRLAEMKPVRYRARDGVEIPAYLTLPKGVEPKQLRAVIVPHGGPWARDQWGYSPLPQLLANRGYAVLQPNFRGSTGYGKRFLNLGNKQWGTGTMQHDLTDGAKWLAAEGIADPRRIAILGGSYGGYATLAGLAFTPDVYAAGVDIVGPSSIVTLLESLPPYWIPAKKMFAVRVGDLEKPEEAARLEAQSPLHAVKAIRAPLLVIQGANDPRVKRAESDQIVVALRDLGRPVEYLVAPDEGHGFQGRENRIAMFAAAERFLARYLGGRAQEGMPHEIAARLAAITVDPKTVTLAEKKPEAAGGGRALAFVGASLRPGVTRYRARVETMGRTIDATSTVTVKAGGAGEWMVVEETAGQMGTGTDTTWLDAKTLAPLRRSVKQGPATIDLAFAPGSVKGKMKAGAQEMNIDAKVDGAVFLDGTPLHVALGTADLAPGSSASLATYDLLGGVARARRVDVKAAEEVTVAAGRFAALRVEVTGDDGGGADVVWVERAAPHRVVKWEATLPAQMGGGKARAELLGDAAAPAAR